MAAVRMGYDGLTETDMPHDKTLTVYTFDELDEPAKERARDWMRELEAQDFDPDYVLEDAATVCDILGIVLKSRTVSLMGGGTRQKPTFWYSGFGSQGDGACFEGTYYYGKHSR